jgi:hypothetical protein
VSIDVYISCVTAIYSGRFTILKSQFSLNEHDHHGSL